MSKSTATFPVLGHSLIADVSRLLAALFAALKPKAEAKAEAKAVAAPPSPDSPLWNLYRMSASMDSVDPALFVNRIVQD